MMVKIPPLGIVRENVSLNLSVDSDQSEFISVTVKYSRFPFPHRAIEISGREFILYRKKSARSRSNMQLRKKDLPEARSRFYLETLGAADSRAFQRRMFPTDELSLLPSIVVFTLKITIESRATCVRIG